MSAESTKRRYHAKKPERKRLVDELARFLKKQSGVDFAYLFGSFLEEAPSSDIDIAIAFHANTDPMNVARLEIYLTELMPYPVEVVDLNRAPLAFRFRVISTGTLLMQTDDNRRCDFEERVMVSYADIRPFHQRWYREVVLGSG